MVGPTWLLDALYHGYGIRLRGPWAGKWIGSIDYWFDNIYQNDRKEGSYSLMRYSIYSFISRKPLYIWEWYQCNYEGDQDD